MKRLFAFVVAAICVAGIGTSVWAVPARPGLYRTEIQPDGTQVKVFIHGDEWFNYETDSLGNVFERDEDGRLKRDSRGFLINTHRKMTDRRKSSLSPIGKPREIPRVLVILVQYKDTLFHPGNTDKKVWNDFFSKDGYDFEGANGSVREYFMEQSGGKYQPLFDVVGPVTVNHDWSWTRYSSYDKQQSIENTQTLLREACGQLNDEVDFSKYDADKDGKVDLVCLVHAGYSYPSTGWGIWPHYNTCSFEDKFDGKQLCGYCSISEMELGLKRTGIGHFCHEFSHALGLPDLDDNNSTTNGSNRETVWYWSLMDHGNWLNGSVNPPNYSIFEKYVMGWDTPKQLKLEQKITLEPSKSGYCIARDGKMPAYNHPDTVYYIENRQKFDWDEYVPGHGLLIWRVIYNQHRWENNTFNCYSDSVGVTLLASKTYRSKWSGKIFDNSDYGCAYCSSSKGLTDKNTDAFPGDAEKTQTGVFGCMLSNIDEKGYGDVSFSTSIGAILNGGIENLEAGMIDKWTPYYDDFYVFYLEIFADEAVEYELQYKRYFGDGTEDEDFQTYEYGNVSQSEAKDHSFIKVKVEEEVKSFSRHCVHTDWRLKATSTINGQKMKVYSNVKSFVHEYRVRVYDKSYKCIFSQVIPYGEKDVKLVQVEDACDVYTIEKSNVEYPGSIEIETKDGWLYLKQMPAKNVSIRAEKEPKKYNVYFMDYDGSMLKSQKVPCGSDATPPDNPSYKGMEFLRWDGNYTNIQADTYVYAVYKGGTGHFVDMELEEHTCLDLPPFTEPDYRDKYFAGNEQRALTGDKLVFRFRQFAADGGTVYFRWTDSFDENEDPVWEHSPSTEIGKLTKEEALDSKELLYTFNICNNPLACTDEKTYTDRLAFKFVYNSGGINYDTKPMVFDIWYPLVFRFKISDGIGGFVQAEEDSRFINDFTDMTEHGDYYYAWVPARNQGRVYYSFANSTFKDINECIEMKRLRSKSWTYLETDVDEDGALYMKQEGFIDTISVERQQFKVTFQYYAKDKEGNKISKKTEDDVWCGDAITPPSTDDSYWPFAGWFLNGKIDDKNSWLNVTEEMHFQADYVYPPDPVYYTVTFVDKDGNTIGKAQSVLAHEDAVLPSEVPVFEGWHFIRWDGTYTNVTSDRTIRAVYGKDDLTWKVSYYNSETEPIGEEEVMDGHAATETDIYPYKTGHSFLYWNVPLNEIHKDTKAMAVFDDAELPTYKVTLEAEHGTINVLYPKYMDLDKVTERTLLKLEAVPDEGMEFYYWTNYFLSGVTINRNTTITAHFRSLTAVYYTVTFLDWEATVLHWERVEKGHDAKGPATNPTREGYTFIGWSKPITNITSNLTVIAQYKENPGTGVDNVSAKFGGSRKVFRDGVIYIERNGNTYDVTGRRVE